MHHALVPHYNEQSIEQEINLHRSYEYSMAAAPLIEAARIKEVL
jgi:hypothetical protein